MVKRARRAGNPKVIVGYVRVSKDEQELSPKAQEDAIRAWAAKRGSTVASVHMDELTSVTPPDRRPGLLEAVRAIKAHKAGALVVLRRDRLGRDVVVSAMCERLVQQAGARVISTAGEASESDDPGAVVMRQMIDVFASYERALIKTRTKDALAVLKTSGKRFSHHLPYGMQLAADGTSLEPNPAEQATISRARELRAAGHTFRSLIEELEAEGRLNRAGKPFDLPAIHRMCV
jgi:site-specific DNA recombinase